MTMIDMASQIGAVRREVRNGERDGAATRSVVAAQTYDTNVNDVWDAITSPERIGRWLMPVSGDLRLGGRYQLEGNAGGEVSECEAPHRLAVTWEWGGDVSWVEVTLIAETADRTTLEVEHTAKVPPEWGDFGPGAVGIGWDLMLVGLARHLQDGPTSAPRLDGEAWVASDDGRTFMTESSTAWGEAAIAAGDDADTARTGAAQVAAMYTGQPAGMDEPDEADQSGTGPPA